MKHGKPSAYNQAERDNRQERRPIRSFVLRQGRMSAAKQARYEKLLPLYAIPFSPGLCDFSAYFSANSSAYSSGHVSGYASGRVSGHSSGYSSGRVSGRVSDRASGDSSDYSIADGGFILEIGFGMGHASAEIAEQNPQNNYLGIEVHRPGVAALLDRINERKLTNLRIIQHDAVEVLRYMIADESLSGVHIFFPDPWPKKRHFKRRLIQSEFLKILLPRIAPGGYIHALSDWEDYAQWMLKHFEAAGCLERHLGEQAARVPTSPPPPNRL